MTTVISVEDLTKIYHLGQIGTGTFTNDLKLWWARTRGKPNPLLKIGTNGNQLGEDLWALKDLNFQVEEGEVLGIIGRNGAGKSTLLKILSRVTAPTLGKVKVKGRIASLLEVGTGFHPDLTGRENIYLNGAILGMDRKEIYRKFDEIVDFAEVEKFIDTPVKRYSSGMYVRLAFAVAAHLDPEILVVDEVLSVGDVEFQKKCLGKMGNVANEGRTVLFVSHNMNSIEQLCTCGIFLLNGEISVTNSLQEAIHLYFGNSIKNNRIYEGKPIDSFSISQVHSHIELKVEYSLETEIKMPCLGFNIADPNGRWICGTNPKIDRIERKWKYHKHGNIDVTIQQPKLLDGTYRLAIWFGDGKQNFFIDENCLEFEVVNMVNANQQSSTTVGPVYPLCEWDFH